jgi:tetratricopeptide (TPR) repeat protein
MIRPAVVVAVALACSVWFGRVLLARLLFNSAYEKQRTQQYAHAAQFYKKSLQLDPHYVYAYNNLGTTYGLEGLHPMAEEMFREALARNYWLPITHYALGLNQAKQGNLPAAVAAFETAVAMNPNSATALFELGKARHKLGLSASAVEALRRAAARYPAHHAERDRERLSPEDARDLSAVHTLLGLTYGQLGWRRLALCEFGLALALNAGNRLALQGLLKAKKELDAREKGMTNDEIPKHEGMTKPE